MSRAATASTATVLGAGAWGSTLAMLLAANGHAVRLWTRDGGHAAEIAATGRNDRYLPGVALDREVKSTADLAEALDGTHLVLTAVPAKWTRELLERLPWAPPNLISCAKGVEQVHDASGRPAFRRLSSVMREVFPDVSVGALSGPNLAAEIAAGQPAATTVASEHGDLALAAQRLLRQQAFRVYTSQDLVGVELAGVMKNVIALAAGVADGLELGDNAKSTIITRGLAETVRFGTTQGGLERTFYGLAGLGDLVATCMSPLSRNRAAGKLLAAGERPDGPAMAGLTAEGLGTVRAVHEFATASGLDLPITAEVYYVAYQGKDPREAIDALMSRERKAE